MKSLLAHVRSLAVTARSRLAEPEFLRQIAEGRLSPPR